MGSLFGPPPPPRPPSLPSPLPSRKDVNAVERQKRLEALLRRQRGRSATIATSPRGLLSLRDVLAQRKSLLGE